MITNFNAKNFTKYFAFWVFCAYFALSLSERAINGNSKGGQLFEAILHILNRKVKRSPLICQTFRKKINNATLGKKNGKTK